MFYGHAVCDLCNLMFTPPTHVMHRTLLDKQQLRSSAVSTPPHILIQALNPALYAWVLPSDGMLVTQLWPYRNCRCTIAFGKRNFGHDVKVTA
jgi:hypothetical protein